MGDDVPTQSHRPSKGCRTETGESQTAVGAAAQGAGRQQGREEATEHSRARPKSARKWGSRLSLCQALALVLSSIKWVGQLPGVAPAHQTAVSFKELKQKLLGSARHVRDPREIPRDDGDNDSDKSSHSSGAPPPGCRCHSPQLQAVTGRRGRWAEAGLGLWSSVVPAGEVHTPPCAQ